MASTVVVPRENGFVMMNLESSKQQVVGVWASIIWIWCAAQIASTIRSRLTNPMVYVQPPLNPETAIGCLVIFSWGTPIASKTGKEMMLRDDPWSSIAPLSSTSLTSWITCKGWLWWLGISRQSFSQNTTVSSSNMLFLLVLLSMRLELLYVSLSSITTFVITSFYSRLNPSNCKKFWI